MQRWLNIFMCALLVGGSSSGLLRAENAADTVSRQLEPVRLSAIVNSGTRYLAGFVDAQTGVAYLIPVGGKLFDWRVTAIDEKAMTALLVNPEGGERRLDLTGNLDAEAEGELTPPDMRIKTMAEFIAEHPELTQAPADEDLVPTASAGTTSYEAFIASHPEMDGLTNYVAPELQSHTNRNVPATAPMLELPVAPPVEVP